MNYHHVLPDHDFEYNLLNGYAHRASSFEAQLSILSKQFGFTHDLEGVGCVITFDDGILNNLKIAAPLLKKHDVQAYFFCVEDHIETGNTLWIDRYYLWFSFVPEGQYAMVNETFKLSDHTSRLHASQLVWNWFCAEKPSSKELLQVLDDAYPFDKLEEKAIKHELRLKPMNREELEALKDAGHFIGFHSRSHQVLAHLDPEQLDREIEATSSIYNTSAMAIPFGTEAEISPLVMERLSEKRFSYILLNEQHSRYAGIPRLNLPDSNDRFEIHAHLSGLHTFLSKILGR